MGIITVCLLPRTVSDLFLYLLLKRQPKVIPEHVVNRPRSIPTVKIPPRSQYPVIRKMKQNHQLKPLHSAFNVVDHPPAVER